jgi:crossover junction endodeoxyribonuclease RuvC
MRSESSKAALIGAALVPQALRERIILGIDPGTRLVGYGAVGIGPNGPVLLGAGVIRPSARAGIAERLGAIRIELDRLLAELQPGVVVVEEAFASRNIQSALRIGEGRGVVLACAAAAGIRIEQVPPAVAKKALVGHGAAHKTQVAAMVARTLSLAVAPEPLDATDALALALTHVLRRHSPLAQRAR